LATAIFFIAVVSCEKNNVRESVLAEKNSNSGVIPVEEALSTLSAELNFLYGSGTTKAEEIYSIESSSVQILTKKGISMLTKAGDDLDDIPDTLLYLVNFQNDGGYAVLSATNALSEEVLCITEGGEISVDDFSKAFQRLNVETKSDEDGNDSTFVPIGIAVVPEILLCDVILETAYGIEPEEDEEETKASISGDKYGPYVKTKWGQKQINYINVFNRYTPSNYPAGCVAIATAQIMVANKRPTKKEEPDLTFDGVKCDWDGLETVNHYSTIKEDLINKDTTYWDQAGHFVREIGKHKNCKIRYGSDGSNGYAEGAQRTLQNYGYQDVDKHLGFGKKKQKIATRVIKNGKPVYLDGSGGGSGHAWVLDGVWGDYYHINWGWSGMSDGYFKKGVFKTTSRYEKDDIDTVLGTSAGKYTWNYRLVTYGKAGK